MDPNQFQFECNIPEMLARDLEISECVFASRSMTAGAPSAALALAESTFREPISISSGVVKTSDAAMVYHKLLASVHSLSSIEDEQWDSESPTGDLTSPYRNHSRRRANLSPRSRTNEDAHESEDDASSHSDSASELSLPVGVDSLHLIRTRQQSVATAATSVSGNYSHKPQSPNSCFAAAVASSPSAQAPLTAAPPRVSFSPSSPVEIPSVPQSPVDRPRQGSWVDLDPEPEETDELNQADASFYSHRPNDECDTEENPTFLRARSQSTPSLYGPFGEMALDSDSSRAAGSSNRNAIAYKSSHLPSQGFTGQSSERPSTAGGILSTEKARIVDIHPSTSVTIPRRTTSQHRTKHAPSGSISAISQVAYLVQLPNQSSNTGAGSEMLPSPYRHRGENEIGISAVAVRTSSSMTQPYSGNGDSSAAVAEVAPRPYGDSGADSTPPPPYHQEPHLRRNAGAVTSRRANVPDLKKVFNAVEDGNAERSPSQIINTHTTEKPKSSWHASSANLLINMAGITSHQPPKLRVETGNETLLEKKFGIPRNPSVSTRRGPTRPNAPGIPLPPEVVDTLRISIACFPETMLLSTSLSVETIRTYSKKVRRTRPRVGSGDDDTHSLFSLSESTPDFGGSDSKSSRRWNLPRILSPWRMQQLQTPRPSSPLQRHFQNQTRHADEEAQAAAGKSTHSLSSSVSPSSAGPTTPVWQPVKNIFPRGSNYLCDALYAHLVAYNYIGDLCASMPSAAIFTPGLSSLTHTVGRSNTIARVRHDIDTGADAKARTSDEACSPTEDPRRIPRKAASVLGLSDAAAVEPSMRVNQSAKLQKQQQQHQQQQDVNGAEKRTRKHKESMAGGGHASEHTLRDLHTGLARCVLRLIATLQAASVPVRPSTRSSSLRREHGAEETLLGAGSEADAEYEVVAAYGEMQTGGDTDVDSHANDVREMTEPLVVDTLVMRALVEVVRATEEHVS